MVIHILNLLFPITCVSCHKHGEYICDPCKQRLNFIPPSFLESGKYVDAFYSPFLFANKAVRELIARLKYRRIRPIANILGEMIINYLEKYEIQFPKNATIIPIPLHPHRQRHRGFNQSELIAQTISKALDIPLKSHVLEKTNKTRQQVGLAAVHRRENIKGSFTVPEAASVTKKTVIVIDDVKTTGATIEEAARVLKQAGARRIYAITVAH